MDFRLACPFPCSSISCEHRCSAASRGTRSGRCPARHRCHPAGPVSPPRHRHRGDSRTESSGSLQCIPVCRVSPLGTARVKSGPVLASCGCAGLCGAALCARSERETAKVEGKSGGYGFGYGQKCIRLRRMWANSSPA